MPFTAHKSGRLKGGKGYLTVDNRAAPEALRFPTGEGGAHLVIPAGQRLEVATLTCGHCNRTVVLNPQRTRERSFCRRCAWFVCDLPGCQPDNGCASIEQMLELGQKYPAVDWLARTRRGEPVFMPKLLDRERMY